MYSQKYDLNVNNVRKNVSCHRLYINSTIRSIIVTSLVNLCILYYICKEPKCYAEIAKGNIKYE